MFNTPDDLMGEATYWFNRTTDGLADLNTESVPVWAWAIAGVVIWRTVKAALWTPPRKNRKTKRGRPRWAQRQATRFRHKRWRNEALNTLKALKKRKTKNTAGDEQKVRQTLNAMSPYSFEYLITEGFKRQGAEIRKIQRASGDGGIDGMLKLNGRWHLIQAKRYQTPVSSSMIEGFHQLCQEKRMPGVFVASSGFTQPARQFAVRTRRVKLLDGTRLAEVIGA
jgi:restriction system protein